jgi:hypothetical protein
LPRSYAGTSVKALVLNNRRAVFTLLGCVLVCGFVACELFPGEVVDFYWTAKRWTNAAWHLERPPQFRLAVPGLVLPYEDADGYAVLSAWITASFPVKSGIVVIQREAGTSSPEPPRSIPRSCFSSNIRSEFGEAFSDYSEKNAVGWLFRPSSRPKLARYTLAPASDLISGWSHGEPDGSGDARRREYAVVSAVGFDSHRRRAVLFVSQHYQTGGYFGHLLFRKNGASWQLAKTPICGGFIE